MQASIERVILCYCSVWLFPFYNDWLVCPWILYELSVYIVELYLKFSGRKVYSWECWNNNLQMLLTVKFWNGCTKCIEFLVVELTFKFKCSGKAKENRKSNITLLWSWVFQKVTG